MNVAKIRWQGKTAVQTVSHGEKQFDFEGLLDLTLLTDLTIKNVTKTVLKITTFAWFPPKELVKESEKVELLPGAQFSITRNTAVVLDFGENKKLSIALLPEESWKKFER